MLVTLINIQEMAAKNLDTRDANLHKELELLSKAIAKGKHDKCVQYDLAQKLLCQGALPDKLLSFAVGFLCSSNL